ncbi:Uncharacterized protein PECH_000363 [Penicillium ucsense]|uniref:UBR-type domain-containing protein n=1 Tax=Penicillium ucsense TaxID=2839758 RepID=A0A8J8WFU8_9EURO|nr:Uncharacterized protein PECM_008255 [Penicillium ucsense]KAF7733642.1 Uncharacterized protein PECH_000363 [Penicillium ucsense]
MDAPDSVPLKAEFARRESLGSQNSQTAKEFIDSQIRLEADAREILPYSFDSCTYELGPLRQSLFACLTCNPPPAKPDEEFTPAAVCYSCSIACHGEHTLVELFNKRNFVCDCGTTRMPSTSPCTLREDPKTGRKGVHSQQAAPGNKYNHNFRNQFCGCGEKYDPYSEKGTMFQCLGLGSVETGGCGEDWWHPECLIGLPRDWHKKPEHKESISAGGTDGAGDGAVDDEETPLPPGFPAEDDFDQFICYKCVESVPWLKRYAGASGFLPAVYRKGGMKGPQESLEEPGDSKTSDSEDKSKKRKAEDSEPEVPERVAKKSRENEPGATKEAQPEASSSEPVEEEAESLSPSKTLQESNTADKTSVPDSTGAKPKHALLSPTTPQASFSLFLLENFQDGFCRCAECYPQLAPYPQLREQEDTYEPPLSDDGENGNGARSAGTGSLLERGEAALSNIDRVRAIEGAMIYNHLRDKVKDFLKPFAESGQAVSAEDIKGYFEKLRGDEQGIKDAADGASAGEKGNGGDDSPRDEQPSH